MRRHTTHCMVHVDRLLPSTVPLMEHVMTCQLSQRIITKVYDDNGKVFKSESKRIAFVNVPLKLDGRKTSKAAITRRLRKYKECRIVRIISNHPILTEKQHQLMLLGLLDKDELASLQLIRHMDGQELHDVNGKPMYRMNYFSAEWQKDVDLRTTNPTDYYRINN